MKSTYKLTPEKNEKELYASGHRACAGCGQSVAAKTVARVLGKDTIICNATGCLEVTTTPIPESTWRMPWIHSLFENAAGVATGVLAGLKAQGKENEIKVVAQGGDGGTFDIGFGLISGMWERRENILYVCYDNEGYMNTGYQNSGASMYDASTSTAPAGKFSFGNHQQKKNMPKIAMAHNLAYTAVASVSDLYDLERKVKKALTYTGPKYIQVYSPCIPGWKTNPKDTITIAQLAVDSGIYPIFEAEGDKIISYKKTVATPPKVEEFLKLQKRFAHLFKTEEGKVEIEKIQKMADDNLEIARGFATS